jgi:hypothetical protein
LFQISAFSLQECTNSHAFNIARFFNITSSLIGATAAFQKKSSTKIRDASDTSLSFTSRIDDTNGHDEDNIDDDNVVTDNYNWMYPTSPEEFGVLAVRISREVEVRNAFRVSHKSVVDRLVQKGKASTISQGAQMLSFFRRLRSSY